MSEASVAIGLVQHACSDDKSENVERALTGMREAAARGAQLVCLQELFASTYFPQVQDSSRFDLAEPIDGPTPTAIAKLSKELGITTLASIFERRTAGIYHNTLLALGPDGTRLGMYRKTHIPDDPQFEEKFYFTPGDLGFVSVDTPHCRAGLLVCWDQWYPEAARLTAMRGAQVLFYPTAIGWLPDEKAEQGENQLAAWQTIQRAHAIANGVFTVAVNRVGTETSSAGEIEFWGHSFVCAPNGALLAEAGQADEVLVAHCDLSQNEETRRTWPFFRDRRIDAYSDLLKRWSD